MATTTTTKTVKKVTKTSKTASAASTMAMMVSNIRDFDTISAAIKLITTPEEQKQVVNALTDSQYEVIVDAMAQVDDQISYMKAQIKEMEERVEHIRPFMLGAMKSKEVKSIVTPNKNLGKVEAGRSVSEFTVTIHEFIQLAQDTGHSDAIDQMVSIKKTKAEEFLGKSLVNRITKPSKDEWGKVKFTKI